MSMVSVCLGDGPGGFHHRFVALGVPGLKKIKNQEPVCSTTTKKPKTSSRTCVSKTDVEM